MSASTPNTGVKPPLHVAVGLVTDGDKIFITRRCANSHQGGKWEFPGGKIEPGEDTFAALKRELQEELGIEVQAATPYFPIHYNYPDRQVFLDVWRITQYRGDPHGREGQEARWIACTDLAQLEFPAADYPILHRLWLPALYLISDSRRFGKDRFLPALERALQAGARLIQLREAHLPPDEYQAYARQVAGLCHRYHAKLLLNAEPESALACGADGVHLNSQRLMQYAKRPVENSFLLGASCHSREELHQAALLEADFAVLSPVAPTASHPHAQALGWENFSDMCVHAKLPVYALGGMRVSDVERALTVGAQGVAMISEVWGAASIEQTVAAILRR
ncbi:MAG: Nudix family hydrolase [Gammaproteobacteria bacterium]|nr:Nudix family hydrolase [Gammaproteobacteria bacterium]